MCNAAHLCERASSYVRPRPVARLFDVEEAFGVVVGVVVVVGVIIAGAALMGSGGALGEYGRDSLRLDSHKPLSDGGDSAGTPLAPPTGDSDQVPDDRDAEIRDLIEARNVHRRRRGEAPLDIEAEYARLHQPAADPGIEEEVRTMVLARNERRKRRGDEPLDVEAEVRRMLDEFGA